MRFERSVGVLPQMKTECADTAHDRHDEAHHDPDRRRHRLGGLGIGRGETLRTGEGLADRRSKKRSNRQNNSRLHVMMRSRFIVFQNQIP